MPASIPILASSLVIRRGLSAPEDNKVYEFPRLLLKAVRRPDRRAIIVTPHLSSSASLPPGARYLPTTCHLASISQLRTFLRFLRPFCAFIHCQRNMLVFDPLNCSTFVQVQTLYDALPVHLQKEDMARQTHATPAPYDTRYERSEKFSQIMLKGTTVGPAVVQTSVTAPTAICSNPELQKDHVAFPPPSLTRPSCRQYGTVLPPTRHGSHLCSRFTVLPHYPHQCTAAL